MNNLSIPDTLDLTLRPKTWAEYVGQEKLKRNLRIIIDAAKKRGEPLEHLLFYGNSGLGKTSLAHIIANEMAANIKMTSGPAIERAGDLAAIITNLSEGDILFIDECHRLNKLIEEYLYPAMEDFKLNIVIGKGPMANTMELPLPRFTLIGATTKAALISAPLRNRFGATFQLNFYELGDIEKIILRSSKILGVEIEPEAAKIIAQRSRFTPRVANRLLKRVRDFAQVEGQGKITEDIAKKSLGSLEVDELGLEFEDRKLLETLITKFDGGPVGLQTLAAAISEEQDTLLDMYEPYLMQLGFIERTAKGRLATRLAYQHLGLKHRGSQNLL
ncbi:MAG: Holliday junction branch migration DNA helicase RuvB [Candidatus Nealsonbacteria bacterium]|nr:Holliday junction branch migration DNA helicase RuvB [Candidatus Nealsonbacteria bacterium]